jgi:SAM-dependent methyltransferase
MHALSERPRIQRTRWQEAQAYERGFWHQLGEGIENGTVEPLDWYQWRARRVESLVTATGWRAVGTVLEIGSGPIGIVNFMEWGERYAIDPLESFYREQSTLVRLRRPGTTYLGGSGECLPFHDGSCSLVVIDNVIDHTFEPERILREIWRVLGADGRLYLTVNIHTRWGAILHHLLSVLHIDKGHPYTFTNESVGRLVTDRGFVILLERIGDYVEARQADRASGRATDRIKGYTGLSEFEHLVVCRKARGAGH